MYRKACRVVGCGHIYDVTKVYLMSYLTVVSAFGRHCGHTTQLTKKQLVLISPCKFFCLLFFSLASCLVTILHIYICSSRTCEKKCHILIGCLFVNLRLTHKPCLGITIVSLYCFGSPRRKFSNYSWSEQRSGHITEIANYSYPRLKVPIT